MKGRVMDEKVPEYTAMNGFLNLHYMKQVSKTER
jgi:hypothetical protein